MNIPTTTLHMDGHQWTIPQGACNTDHDLGKTKWQRIAEIFDTAEDPPIIWSSDYTETGPQWTLGRSFALTEWALGVGTDREYGSPIGPNRWTVWLNLGPFAWWLTGEWPANEEQRS